MIGLVVLALALPAQETVRIAVGRFPHSVTISGDDLEIADIAQMPKNTVTFTVGKSGLVLAGKTMTSDIVRIRSTGNLKVGAHKYRKELVVQWRRYDKRPEILVVHPIDLETYVTGIVSSELPGGWPLEAYKAQAIASRTFALWQKYRRLDLPYHMESTVLDQVYGGVEREHALAEQATRETSGMVLSFRHHLAQAYFHASCGDRTESAHEGWGTRLEYLPGSRCGFCKVATRYGWSASVARKDVDKALSPLLGESVASIAIVNKTKSGRVKSIELKGASKKKTITGADLRRLLGYNTLWSTWIDKLELKSDALVASGKGSGHGVGMCQWGARGMSDAGKTYEEILMTYYPGTTIKRVY